jgi:hypothetical protein
MACESRRGPKVLGSTSSTLFKGKLLPAVNTKTLILRSPWVGFVATTSGIDTSTTTVVARNLQTDALVYCGAGGARAPEPAPSVTSLALTRNGGLAWIGTSNLNPSGIDGPLVSRVAECGANGALKTLDEGEGIDLRSLELHGFVLRWTDGGQVRTATLP